MCLQNTGQIKHSLEIPWPSYVTPVNNCLLAIYISWCIEKRKDCFYEKYSFLWIFKMDFDKSVGV